MRKGLILTQGSIVFFFFFAVMIFFQGRGGSLASSALYTHFYPPIERAVAPLANLKFQLRGAQNPKSPIVIVAVDEVSLEYMGRWPWPRAYLVELINRIYEAGAKVVGVDIIFSESQQNIPETLQEELKRRGLGKLIHTYDDDALIEALIRKNRDRLVSVWQSEGHNI